MTATYQETREIDFIPLEWVERAAHWVGLRVFSRVIKVTHDLPCRRSASRDVYIDDKTFETIEKLIDTELKH